jgi:hypothetical protein
MLSVLQDKLGEAHGLAIASDPLAARVAETVERKELRAALDRMRQEAWETRTRCGEAALAYGEVTAGEILARANVAAERAADLAGSWFKAGTDPLGAWTFLAMGEAAEVATWSSLVRFARRDGSSDLRELAAWGLGTQEQHLRTALDAISVLAASTDPSEPRWG